MGKPYIVVCIQTSQSNRVTLSATYMQPGLANSDSMDHPSRPDVQIVKDGLVPRHTGRPRPSAHGYRYSFFGVSPAAFGPVDVVAAS